MPLQGGKRYCTVKAGIQASAQTISGASPEATQRRLSIIQDLNLEKVIKRSTHAHRHILSNYDAG